MKLERIDSASLAPYLPIEDVRSNLIAMVLTLLVSIPAITWFGINVLPADGRILACAFLCLIPLLMIVLLTGNMIWALPESEGRLFKWARLFVDRNVHGYELRCVRNIYGDPTVTYEIHRRGTPTPYPGKKVMVSVPLQTGVRCGVIIPDMLGFDCWWTIRVHDISLSSLNAVPVVRMENSNGDRFTIDVESALRVLASEKSSLEDYVLTSHGGSVGRLVNGLMSRLDAARHELLTERLERDKAVGDIEEAVADIKATTRFQHSKEAAAVRARLVGKLAEHLQFRDIPRRKRDAA